ncbi:MATE family efflux transporter [Halorhabdus sp. BNX81]|uniref:MATE family efflux transporter n=1 Tax=Halorhabdus sp. BNX81 TaxID=2980181 RepID=UPI0023DD0EE6|nr:MATE family efflux transporter [Halorhabdus sp. BNX81]WEL20910.1 Na+-driven multidrug efflux pump [Halorhabdus sp. BNX81]
MSLFKGQSELELTEGGILRPLFYLSLPIVVTNLLQVAYNIADTFWLAGIAGEAGTDAVAGITFAFPIVFLLISMGMGLSVAGSVLVAQHTGAGESDQASVAASQTVTWAILGSAVLGLLGFPLVGPLIEFLGASPSVLPGARAYMQVISLGLPFMFGFFVFIALMRGAGDTITPMVVMFGTVVLNIALDPFLIYGWTLVENAPFVGTVAFPQLGIQGAAIATVFSRSLAMIVGLAIMFSGRRGVPIDPRAMVPDLGYLRTLLRVGLPASVESTGRALSVNAMLLVVGTFADPVVAAFGIGTRVFSVIFLPAIAVGRGVETMTGQNIGAGKPDRAGTAAYAAAKVMFAILSILGLIIFLVPRPIVTPLSPNAEVTAIAVEFMRYTALSFGFIGIIRAFSGSFRGAGKTLIAAAIAVLTLGVVRLSVAAVASQYWLGVQGIWAAFFVSNVAGALIAWLWYRRGSWRDGDVRETSGTGSGGPVEDEPEPTVGDD